MPHTPGPGPSPAAAPLMVGATKELTVVRIPLRSAKHHFGASVSRGMRPYNEDTYQAGTIDIPAFAKRAPVSLSRAPQKDGTGGQPAESTSGDPQVFYFGVFDGHGGHECSDFLREELHTYVENTVDNFQLQSSLKKSRHWEIVNRGRESLHKGDGQNLEKSKETPASKLNEPDNNPVGKAESNPSAGNPTRKRALIMQRALVSQWKETVGGYFRRFRPDFFNMPSSSMEEMPKSDSPISLESALMYSFLKADLDFVSAQSRKPDPNEHHTDKPLNEDDILGEPSYLSPSHTSIGGPNRFFGGSTASVAIISTPTPTPFWHPASPSTLLVAHVGDTRILLCDTATGLARPMTTNHHPNTPNEGRRLRRYAATFVTDSFGEERISGLANTRAFGDIRSKRIGVSAEPEIKRLELSPAEYSFMVLVSDGVSGTLSDQEIVDVVKEARTPEQGARDVVSFATEVGKEGDNATCMVVRLGGWERRGEGGVGSLGTKETREWRRGEAADPRRGRM